MTNLGLHLCIVHDSWSSVSRTLERLALPHTILCFAEPGLDIIQGQVRHSALEIVEIHPEEAATAAFRLKMSVRWTGASNLANG